MISVVLAAALIQGPGVREEVGSGADGVERSWWSLSDLAFRTVRN